MEDGQTDFRHATETMNDKDPEPEIAQRPEETAAAPKGANGTNGSHSGNGNGSNGSGGNGSGRVADGWLGRLRALVGLRPASTMRDDLADALAQDVTAEEEADQVFSPEERMYLRNILNLRETRVEDVMVPRADIDAVDQTTPLGDLLRRFEESGHSRMPVYAETLDDPRGMIHIKDLMAYLTETADVPPAPEGKRRKKMPANLDLRRVDLATPLKEVDLVRKLLFVPPSMPATSLLAKMQTSRTQMALVIDEYGGTDGLVSLEDIVEVVVGDIEDEHDEDTDPMLVASGEGAWTADARIEIEDAAEEIGADFSIGDHGEEVDTLGGLLFSLVDRVPVRGELITSPDIPGFEFEVLDADPRRIKRLRIYRKRLGPRSQVKRPAPKPASGPAGEAE